jgi:hypothetical protein
MRSRIYATTDRKNLARARMRGENNLKKVAKSVEIWKDGRRGGVVVADVAEGAVEAMIARVTAAEIAASGKSAAASAVSVKSAAASAVSVKSEVGSGGNAVSVQNVAVNASNGESNVALSAVVAADVGGIASGKSSANRSSSAKV